MLTKLKNIFSKQVRKVDLIAANLLGSYQKCQKSTFVGWFTILIIDL